jgi:2,4-dienoyl-CoA reductase-like NADH-dependent reductase (Old Yellow Enzyme family)/thioredoxin reductase
VLRRGHAGTADVRWPLDKKSILSAKVCAVTHFRRLFEPLQIGSFTVKNRIVSTTHASSLPRDRDLAYLARKAEGGVGFIGLSGGSGVIHYGLGPGTPGGVGEWDRKAPSPVSAEGIAFYDNLVLPGLRERAELLHAKGAHCFAQIAHGGGSQHWPLMMPPLGPSDVPDPYDGHVPHALTDEQIEELIVAFAHGVRRIREAGVDAAEIHGAHGYLVMQFLSPYYNRRTDKWGGSAENRTRFLREIIAVARRLAGDEFPIGLRLGYEGDGQGRGLTVKDAVEVARQVATQVAYISVSGGSYSGLADGFNGAYVSPWYREPAYNASAAAAVRAAAGVPVLLTGRIADAALAESLLAEGSADLIGMVRALIADPDLPAKAREGKADQVRMCLGLSECHHIGRHRVPITCAVNAASGREQEMAIQPAAETKTVVVVGAGPAGLEAARVAALRGHHVYLADSRRHIGGTVRLLGQDPNRRNLLDHAAYFETVLPRLNVELLLGNRVTADDIRSFGADAVILATGSVPVVPEIEGLRETSGVLTAIEVLGGRTPGGEHVLVVGGTDNHLAAPTIAEYLTDLGHRVTMVSEQVDFASGAEDATRLALLQRLKKKHVRVALTSRVVSVDADGATIMDTFTHEHRREPGVALLLACGMTPNDELYRELSAHGIAGQVIGDALAPRRIMHATVEGARAGLAV